MLWQLALYEWQKSRLENFNVSHSVHHTIKDDNISCSLPAYTGPYVHFKMFCPRARKHTCTYIHTHTFLGTCVYSLRATGIPLYILKSLMYYLRATHIPYTRATLHSCNVEARAKPKAVCRAQRRCDNRSPTHSNNCMPASCYALRYFDASTWECNQLGQVLCSLQCTGHCSQQRSDVV